MLLAGKRAAFRGLFAVFWPGFEAHEWVVLRKWLAISYLPVFDKGQNAWLICDQKNPDAKQTSGLYEIFMAHLCLFRRAKSMAFEKNDVSLWRIGEHSFSKKNKVSRQGFELCRI